MKSRLEWQLKSLKGLRDDVRSKLSSMDEDAEDEAERENYWCVEHLLEKIEFIIKYAKRDLN